MRRFKVTVSLQKCVAYKRCSAYGLNCRYLKPSLLCSCSLGCYAMLPPKKRLLTTDPHSFPFVLAVCLHSVEQTYPMITKCEWRKISCVILFHATPTPPKMGCVRGLRSWRTKKKLWMKAPGTFTSALCAHRYVQLMRENIYFLEMSNCKRQSRAESFLQIENRRNERHSELAVNKSSEAT